MSGYKVLDETLLYLSNSLLFTVIISQLLNLLSYLITSHKFPNPLKLWWATTCTAVMFNTSSSILTGKTITKNVSQTKINCGNIYLKILISSAKY